MLSILVPAYNYDITLLVKMVHSQCVAAGITFEIIVADDSPDSAHRLANKSITLLEHCFFIENESNFGRTLTRKRLAEAATGSHLLFLDADVLPADNLFIQRYLHYIDKDNIVLMGGYAYRPVAGQPVLRLKYGMKREEKPAAQRNRNPYASVFSGNFMTTKAIFLNNNYPGKDNFYGLDIYFSYCLYTNGVQVLHIDNPIIHLGLEEDEVFFSKCLESVRVRKKLLVGKPGVENINPLLRYHNKLQQLGLKKIVAFIFRLAEPLLKKRILSKDPDLFCLDLYRLGYICTLK